jgi:hypothetical protein
VNARAATSYNFATQTYDDLDPVPTMIPRAII